MRTSLALAIALAALLVASAASAGAAPALALTAVETEHHKSAPSAPAAVPGAFTVAANAVKSPMRINAAPVVSSRSGGANLRTYPWAAAFRWVPNGTQLIMICWRDSIWMNGNYWTNRWFYVTALVGGRYYNPSGYMHASLVANQATVPWCPRWYEPSGG